MIEIERKWLLDDFPKDLEPFATYRIRQGYLSINPEVRIRSKVNKENYHTDFKLTIKENGDIARIEVEKELEYDEFNYLLTMINKSMINKDYRKYKFRGHTLEISSVDIEGPNGFYYAEVEFESIEEANNFVAPDWFGKEVTTEDHYKMKNYFNRTRNGGTQC